jgi:antirestriction protein
MLDLHEVAGEWQELIEQRQDSLDAIEEVPSHDATASVLEDYADDIAKFEDLSRELGVDSDSIDPNGLKLWGDHNDSTLIPENGFEDYARELAEDIGAISSDTGWPATCIDWERAARELQMDYTSVEYDGDTYYYRA